MNNIKRVISIGGHPLDAELMGGPIIIKYAALGAKCTFVNVVQGRLEGPNVTKEENDRYVENLIQENINVAKAMNSDCKSFGYNSKELPTENEFIDILVKYFTDEKVDLVITHFSGTLHPRHYYTHYTVKEAVKICRNNGMDIKLLYGENCEDLVGFVPQAYYELSESEVDTWFNALRKYEIFNGKVNSVPYYDYYKTMGKVRSMECGSRKFTKAYMYASYIENL
ncbi:MULTISPECIES: PIG-L deacetylase family protein [Clostridium]|jgi:LmbE family N-acetylglucosaminyl deacetylase|uniref:PIG-L deacetylase family protein n=1 Tax=Clostridium TaxID=1485 RepID=UPI0011582A9B|nr:MULTISPECIES: PIG-L family deacetylase [Clostridium]MBP1869873.1 LmbE family N-acetylglucosaminyl deacetylase [Clostridium tertium]MBS6501255.1 PIG-L family deacetylase [Clostridium sp.]MDB1933062.1 PIG-L family deacetylase [Clostridium tertium]MDB1938870.1 PIG-L family deacetylase [Clostridium tertium]MDU6363128.1 PIG-L family deacetylase [Clostridium sp.]